jgi:lipopolysaccharide transport system ATP-binding protein
MAISIKVENVSKVYQLGQISSGTISQDLQRWWRIRRGKDDPFLIVGEANNSSKNDKNNIVWSLKDITFDINQGECVGIIGSNGAGKSTLLKILSQITGPSSGYVKIKGRVASLLEVGTGFHPELSGRENIFLNGAILGMRKHEIKTKFDEIVDFSGVERYIDTPVKRYSSGMYVRLAFAVAAHLESEILIVDEVLAVGDADFQKKCLGKMGDISKSDGRTVLFVSHNMHSIQKLCPKSIYLSNGYVKEIDKSFNVINNYLSIGSNNNVENSISSQILNLNTSSEFEFKDVKVIQNGKSVLDIVKNGSSLEILITYKINIELKNFRLYFDLFDNQGILLIKNFHDCDSSNSTIIQPGLYNSKVVIPSNFLAPKKYFLKIGATIFGSHELAGDGINFNFSVVKDGLVNRGYTLDVEVGLLAPLLIWENLRQS